MSSDVRLSNPAQKSSVSASLYWGYRRPSWLNQSANTGVYGPALSFAETKRKALSSKPNALIVRGLQQDFHLDVVNPSQFSRGYDLPRGLANVRAIFEASVKRGLIT